MMKPFFWSLILIGVAWLSPALGEEPDSESLDPVILEQASPLAPQEFDGFNGETQYLFGGIPKKREVGKKTKKSVAKKKKTKRRKAASLKKKKQLRKNKKSLHKKRPLRRVAKKKKWKKKRRKPSSLPKKKEKRKTR